MKKYILSLAFVFSVVTFCAFSASADSFVSSLNGPLSVSPVAGNYVGFSNQVTLTGSIYRSGSPLDGGWIYRMNLYHDNSGCISISPSYTSFLKYGTCNVDFAKTITGSDTSAWVSDGYLYFFLPETVNGYSNILNVSLTFSNHSTSTAFTLESSAASGLVTPYVQAQAYSFEQFVKATMNVYQGQFDETNASLALMCDYLDFIRTTLFFEDSSGNLGGILPILDSLADQFTELRYSDLSGSAVNFCDKVIEQLDRLITSGGASSGGDSVDLEDIENLLTSISYYTGLLRDTNKLLTNIRDNLGYDGVSNRKLIWDFNELFRLLNGGYRQGVTGDDDDTIFTLLKAINQSIQAISIEGGSSTDLSTVEDRLQSLDEEIVVISGLLDSMDGNLDKVVKILEDADFQIIVNMTNEYNSTIQNYYNEYNEIENNFVANFNTHIGGVETAISDWDITNFNTPVAFVGSTFSRLYDALGDFKVMIIAPLVLGFVLLFIGRGKKVL